MKIGLLNIATNRYMEFAEPLYKSAIKFFLDRNKHEVTFFLFTNVKPQFKMDNIELIEQEHYPWPGMTLRRYEIFCNNYKKLEKMDYLFYCDIDMLFENHIGDEIIGKLVGTIHPGYYNVPSHSFPYDRNPKSRAYIRFDRGINYYAGGFNGGKSEDFLKMSETIYKNILEDHKIDYIAEWHDESHLNRYFLDNPPSVVLDPSYCFPIDAVWAKSHPYRKFRKLCALEKDHKSYQI
jgi:histo-blood group ABO system transferase